MANDVLDTSRRRKRRVVVRIADQPEAWGVVYATPNPDGSRKNCVNCMMWSRDEKCSIHEEGQRVESEDVCGYHVYGKPMDKRMAHPGMDPLKPIYSGLDHVGGGTSCDICTYYRPGGFCAKVQDGHGNMASVHAKGCCAAWESMKGE